MRDYHKGSLPASSYKIDFLTFSFYTSDLNAFSWEICVSSVGLLKKGKLKQAAGFSLEKLEF